MNNNHLDLMGDLGDTAVSDSGGGGSDSPFGRGGAGVGGKMMRPPPPQTVPVPRHQRAAAGQIGGFGGAGSGVGGLPSFNDILWCTDVDGDVMTAGMDVNMVSIISGASDLKQNGVQVFWLSFPYLFTLQKPSSKGLKFFHSQSEASISVVFDAKSHVKTDNTM